MVTIPALLADYLYQNIETIAENVDGEYSAEDSAAARELRHTLEDAVIDKRAAKVLVTPEIRAMLLTGWEGTDVLDAVANIAQHSWDDAESRQVNRQITSLRRKLAETPSERTT